MSDFPDDADGEALRKLASHADMGKPMKIDFFVVVPDEVAGSVLATRVQARGYVTSVEHDDPTGQWTCYCGKELVPTYDAIIAAQSELERSSADVGGYTDGWGASGASQ